MISLINLLNRSLAVELNKFLGLLQGKGQCCSKQAFSKQREKLAPSAFVALNDALIEEFYRDNLFEHFHGLRLLACDGSTFSLPNTASVIDYFGVVTNQRGSVAMGRCSTIFDVLNQLTLSAVLKPYKADERSMLFEQLESLQTSIPSLLLLDRGYPSFLVMALLQKKGLHFIMRLPLSNSFAEALTFAASQEKDAVIDFDLKQGSRQSDKPLQEVVSQLPCSVLRLRLLRFTLPSGETEYLISDLTDSHQYPSALFYQAYGFRWAIETQFRVEKVQLEIENFSGKKKESVLQEFHASILCSNLQALLALDAAERRTQKKAGKKPLKHEYKINRAVSLGLLKDELLSLLDSKQSLEEAYEQLIVKMQRFVISSPPGRKFPRKRKRKHKNTSKRRRPT